MLALDGRRIVPGVVIGVDLSLTGPGLARICDPWGKASGAAAVAVTVSRVPQVELLRGQVLMEAAERVARSAFTIAVDGGGGVGTLVVMEALLLQSATGKAPERAAFWWMVRGRMEMMGMAVASVHPTTRRSLAHDSEAAELMKRERANGPQGVLTKKQKDAEKARLSRLGKLAGMQSIKRRWSGVTLPDDNAADALVCAEVGAHALGFAGLPAIEAGKKKILTGAIQALGVTKEEASK